MIDITIRRRLQEMGIPDEVIEIVGKWLDANELGELNSYETQLQERLGIDRQLFLSFTGHFGLGVGLLMRAGVTMEEIHKLLDLLYPTLEKLVPALEAFDQGRRS